jgi:penicillin-binding protein 1B
MTEPPVPDAAVARPWWRRPRWWIVGGAAVLLLLLGLILAPFWKLASQFDDITFRQPSRLLADPTALATGAPASAAELVAELKATGYAEDPGTGGLPQGCYRRIAGGLAVDLRRFPTPDGRTAGGLLEIAFSGSKIGELRLDGTPVREATLEPALLHTYYGPTMLERRPLRLAGFSKDLVAAVLAAEDDNFYRHAGVSVSGIARALWVNVRGGGVRQGGSTLTQQLVKNLYLSHERTLWRKGQELILAVLIELRYSKQEILEAYLNEIYMGSLGGVNLTGMQAASRAYFSKEAADLTLAEAAMLAAMIPSPAKYSPIAHPEAAKARRDFVLGRLHQLERVDAGRLERALATPIATRLELPVRRRAPYFADAVRTEAERRFKLENLEDAGYTLFSTLSWRDQRAAQQAIATGLQAAEKGYERGNKTATSPLQAALVSVDPKTGGILAYLGGRRYEKSQFDRAGQAKRQVGSTFKPIVYAAAFETRKVSPTSKIEDSPLTVRQPGLEWSPKNDDGSFHGWVTVRHALEHSYNPATARLALQVGMNRIVELAHRMGLSADMDPFPSIALGAVEVTPVELATVYATLAAGGVRPPVHGIVAVRDRFGKRVAGSGLPAPERVVSPQSTYMVTSLLQGVVARGTGRGAASGIRGDVAGKTGTTNKRRDTWFAGFSPERATVVWVGYDDNSATRLSGARAPLPIWNRFTAAVVPARGFSYFRRPPGLTTATIDPTNGLLATEFCPARLNEVFRPSQVPQSYCDLHQSYLPEDLALTGEDGEKSNGDPDGEAADDDGPNPVGRFFRLLFGRDKPPPPPPPPPSGPPS